MEGIGKGLAQMLYGCFFVALLIGAAIACLTWYTLSSSEIKSDRLIKPRIELTTDGKTVDTLYIYEKP